MTRAVVGAGLGLGLAGVAWAWQPLPEGDWSWQAEPVADGFHVAVDAFRAAPGGLSAWEAALRDGADAWTWGSDAHVALRLAGPSYGTVAVDDAENLVTWDGGAFGGTVLAWARVWSDASGITECDILFQGTSVGGPIPWSVDEGGASGAEFDAARVAMHEFGHCLGLGHSTVSGAIMQSIQPRATGPAALSPSADDDAGLIAIYGARHGPLLLVDAFVVGDTAGGDGDGVLSQGEQADVIVTVVNVGTSAAVGVDGALSAREGAATVQIGATSFGTILPGDAVTADPLRVALASCGPHHVASFDVSLTDDGGTTWAGPLAFPVRCDHDPFPVLAATGGPPDDDRFGGSEGNGNGVAEWGERVEVPITLTNDGQANALGLSATVSTDPTYASIPFPGIGSWGTLGPGGSAVGAARIDLEPRCPPDETIVLHVAMADGSGRTWASEVTVPMACVFAAEPDLVASIAGIDPPAEVGVVSDLRISVRNVGDAASIGAAMQLRPRSGVTSVPLVTEAIPDLEPGAAVILGPYALGVDADCAEDATGRFETRIETPAGYRWIRMHSLAVECDGISDTGDTGSDDTGDTGDTGPDDTDDTGDTGDTGSDDTGDTWPDDSDDTDTDVTSDPDPACGCAASPSPGPLAALALLAALWTRRQRSRTTTAST